jgi:hypothetical protein
MCRARKRQTLETVEPRRRKEPERVPPLSPGVANPLVGVEDDKAATSSGEMVTNRQTSLPATDDNGFDPLGIAHSVHPSHLHWSGFLCRHAMRGAPPLR